MRNIHLRDLLDSKINTRIGYRHITGVFRLKFRSCNQFASSSLIIMWCWSSTAIKFRIIYSERHYFRVPCLGMVWTGINNEVKIAIESDWLGQRNQMSFVFFSDKKLWIVSLNLSKWRCSYQNISIKWKVNWNAVFSLRLSSNLFFQNDKKLHF